jgi:hypothetical protein
MSLTASPGSPSRVGAQRSIWDVPVAIWAYGLLRSLAFIAPSWTEDGQIGLGVVVVLVLYVFLVRRSRRAWVALVVLDTFSHVMLLTAWLGADESPWAIPILAAASLVALLMPSTRRYASVGREPAGTLTSDDGAA